jgi:homocysteine S-methyltransferase
MDKHMSQTLILDGGMGRELKRIGAPFQQPEWSALALLEGPHFVEQAHDAFVNAGARVITTNSYAVVPFHIGQQRFEQHGEQLAALAGQLARRSADKAAHKVLVVRCRRRWVPIGRICSTRPTRWRFTVC